MFNLSLPGYTALSVLPLPLGQHITPFALPTHILSKQASGFPRTSLSPDDIPFVEQFTVLEVKGLSNYSVRGKPGGMMNL